MRMTWLTAPTEKDHCTTVAALRTCFGHQAGTAPYDGAFFERHGGGGDRGEVPDVILLYFGLTRLRIQR